jgi:hypothetical protein
MTPPHETHLSSNTETYAQDFYAWCLRTAALVREGHWDAIDQEALIEELESLGKSQYRDLESRLDVLTMHLLKWQYQPLMRETGHSWASTIVEQRKAIARVLRDSPSLRPQVPDILEDLYPDARAQAAIEMGGARTLLPPRDLVRLSRLPTICPWTAAQVLDKDFWPGESP